MKSIYTTINNIIYQIDQNTGTPIIINDSLHENTTSHLVLDKAASEVHCSININTLKKEMLQTNKEMYQTMTHYITDNKITQIDRIQNRFKVYVDYSIFGQRGEELEHSVLIRPIHVSDAISPLGVTESGECVYRRVKLLTDIIDFQIKNRIPFGISESGKQKHTLKINNIIIYQDMRNRVDHHESIYSTPFIYGSNTVETSLEYMHEVYSTKNDNVEIDVIHTDFIPRKISIAVKVILSNYVVVYDDKVINQLLIDNINSVDDLSEYNEIDKTSSLISTYSSFDNSNYFYTKSTSSSPNSLRVVEDLYPQSKFDENNMVRKIEVLSDIPEINLGDYVEKITNV